MKKRSQRQRCGLFELGFLCSALLILPAPLEAQPGREKVKQGNRLYSEGKYQEARNKYLEALAEAPDSPLIRFNEGNALYRSEDFQKALESYRDALEMENPQAKSQAWYNLGNALYRQQHFEESAEAYKEALRHAAGDQDSKHNLEMALRKLQEQQQPQQSKDQQDRKQQEQEQQTNASQDQQDRSQEKEASQEQQRDQAKDSQKDDPSSEPPRSQAQNQQEQQAQRQHGEAEQTGALNREAAERLLQAIREKPGEIRRQQIKAAPKKRVERDW